MLYQGFNTQTQAGSDSAHGAPVPSGSLRQPAHCLAQSSILRMSTSVPPVHLSPPDSCVYLWPGPLSEPVGVIGMLAKDDKRTECGFRMGGLTLGLAVCPRMMTEPL